MGQTLLRAIAGHRPDIKTVCLAQGHRLTGFNARGKAGQCHDRRSRNREYRQGGKRFDHWGRQILAGKQSRDDRVSVDNNPHDPKFPSHNLYLKRSRSLPKWGRPEEAPSIPAAGGDQRLAEGLEQRAVDRIALRIVFRMPLHAERKAGRIRDPDRLDGAVLRHALDHHPLAGLEDALAVQRVDADFLASEDFRKRAAGDEA